MEGMKYALVLEKDSALCNNTSSLVSSMGYLITPVFNPKKALHAAHMIQFDLIVTCTAVNPGDRRSLTVELKRCSPEAVIVLVVDPELGPRTNGSFDGVNAVLYRPLSVPALHDVINAGFDHYAVQAPPFQAPSERRRRAID
jgi:DNA-binding response OmpR family regulator